MRDIKYGANPIEFPPVAAHRASVQTYERLGLDFVNYWDQHVLTIPRSLWTPDLCPAAEMYHIDSWLEPFALMTDAALATERIRIALTVTDVIRRPPSVLAQLGATLDHYSEGRFVLGLGAGEDKQCRPYGIPRDKPFGRLEEYLKLIKKWWSTFDPIDYEGTFYNVKQAAVGAAPFTAGGPQVIVAGGPGKALRYAAQLADGWFTYTPPGSPTAEQYAEEVEQFDNYARAVGKDPDGLTKMLGFCVVLGDTEDEVEEACRNSILRWDAACLVPGGHAWQRHGETNPLGDDWAYSRDLFPLEWSREDALKIVDQVSPDMVRNMRFCGTPEQVADMIQPFVEAGCNSLMIGDYAALVNSGSFGQVTEGTNRLIEVIERLREKNGQPALQAVTAGS